MKNICNFTGYLLVITLPIFLFVYELGPTWNSNCCFGAYVVGLCYFISNYYYQSKL